jgi:hypothetical protein
MGILAGTDNHMSKPGSVEESVANVVLAEGPYTGGLTAVLATGKTRGEIFDAIKARRTYGTSGPRIGLSFTATAGGQSYVMGQSLQAATPLPVTLNVSATGDTANIARMDIIKNGVLFDSVDGLNIKTATWTGTDTVTGRAYYRVKVFQRKTRRWDDGPIPDTWHAERAWSSPIWVEAALVTPQITSTAATAFTAGTPGSFNVTATGVPAPPLTHTGTLPAGVTFVTPAHGAATLAGTPATGTGGVYPLTITAHNGVAPSATQSFTLVVIGFTDDPLAPASTPIKLVHVTELRAQIDAVRARHRLNPYSWTDPNVSPGTTPVRAVHVSDLRSALLEAFSAASVTPPLFSDPVLTPGSSVVRAVHISEIRTAIARLWSGA